MICSSELLSLDNRATSVSIIYFVLSSRNGILICTNGPKLEKLFCTFGPVFG